MRTAIGLATLLAATGLARADADATLSTSTPLTRDHWELGLAMLLPAELDQDVGAQAVLARQVGPLRLGLEYAMVGRCAERMLYDKDTGAVEVAKVDAQVHRIGVGARYRVGLGTSSVGTGVYLEGGVGRQQHRFERGPALTRDDVALGFGFEMLGGGAQLVGFDLGGRFTLARGATDDAPVESTATVVLGLLLGS